jgi:hypothetical protein
MTKGAEYRKHAQEGRALARNVQNEEHKAQLLKMAQAFSKVISPTDRCSAWTAKANILAANVKR